MELTLDTGIALKETNDLLQNIKQDLNEVSALENMIEGMDLTNIKNQNINSYGELEILTEEYKKEEIMIGNAKWVLIIFEGLTAYVALNAIVHIFYVPEKYNWLKQIVTFVTGIIGSYLIINASMRAIKNKSKTTSVIVAICWIIIIPSINLGIILFSGNDISYKEIYIISSIISFIGGVTLITWTKIISNKNNGGTFGKIFDKLNKRKKLLLSARNKYSKIFDKFNKSGQTITQADEIKNYKGLSDFLKNCIDFDDWSYEYIKKQKEREREKSFKY